MVRPGGLHTKLLSAILISVILGSIVGFSLGYIAFTSQIQDLRTELLSVIDEVTGLVLAIAEIESGISDVEAELLNLKSDIQNLSSTVDWLADQLTLLRLSAAAHFLYERFNRELQLVSEAPIVAPDIYWLVSDNLLLQDVLREYYPDIAEKIRAGLMELARLYRLPTTAEGLPRSFKHEAVLGERVPLPFNETNFYELETGIDYTIKTEVPNSTARMTDWEEYIDTLCYAALTKHYENSTEAKDYFMKAIGKWDGKGLADKGFTDPNSPSFGKYETYKLALLLFTSKVLGEELDYERDLSARIWECQHKNGGIITHYLLDGTPDPKADANSETTSLVLLAEP